MTQGEYFNFKIEEETNKQLDQILNKFEEYLRKNNERVIIKEKNYSISSFLKFIESMDTFFDENPIFTIDDEKAVIPINNKIKKYLKKIFEENISLDIKKLECPVSFLEKVNILNFPNIKKLSIDNSESKITKQQLEFILGQTNIEEFEISGQFDDEILKDSILIKYNDTTIFGMYKNKIIKSGNASYFNSVEKVYSKNPYKEINNILNLLEYNKDNLNKYIKIFDNLDPQKESVYLRKEESICLEKINDNIYKIELSNIEKIEDVENVLNELKEKDYQIEEVKLNLENKTYDDMIKLKYIDKLYNLNISYNNSFSKITAEEFIMMRATLDYYKNLITQNNLSPLEKAAYGYDLIKSFKYQEVEENEEKGKSRNIHSIIKEGKIVCVGYANFYAQLMKEVGIEGYAFGTIVPVSGQNFGHQRTILKINDPKYNINGSYAFDPTWDSAKGVVKVIDENGNEKLKSLYQTELKEGEKVIKRFDDMTLYRYFLVSRDNYQKKFTGEKMPKLYQDNFYGNEKLQPGIINEDANLNLLNFSLDQFKKLMIKIKLCEGYPKETIEETLNEILEVNGYIKTNEEQLDESVVKR